MIQFEARKKGETTNRRWVLYCQPHFLEMHVSCQMVIVKTWTIAPPPADNRSNWRKVGLPCWSQIFFLIFLCSDKTLPCFHLLSSSYTIGYHLCAYMLLSLSLGMAWHSAVLPIKITLLIVFLSPHCFILLLYFTTVLSHIGARYWTLDLEWPCTQQLSTASFIMAGKVIVPEGGVSNIIEKYRLDTGPEHIGAAGMQSRITYLTPRHMQITPTLALSRNENTPKKNAPL